MKRILSAVSNKYSNPTSNSDKESKEKLKSKVGRNESFMFGAEKTYNLPLVIIILYI